MKLLTALAAGACIAIGAPAAAITTFATFTATSSLPNIDFVGSDTGAGTLSSTAQPVTFRFLNADGSASSADFDASFTLFASTSNGTVVGSLGIAPVTSGSFSFTSASAVTFGGSTGTNFLSGTFASGSLTAEIGGSTANYGNSTPPNTVTFTSDFLDFGSSTARDLAFAITGINPLIEASSVDGGVANFSGTVVGSFGADAFDGGGLAVPEPATWAMMIGGFGMVGGAMRRRGTLPAVAA